MNGTVRFIHAMCLTGLCTLAAAQSSSPAGQCIDEFVQDYVFDDTVTYASVTPCPSGDLNVTPAWPLRRDEIHKEYSRDDFYTRLVKHDSQTGERYGGLISHGGAKARTPRGPDARYENTRFGIECLRTDSRTPGVPASMGSLCAPVLPDPKCRAELYMMPIEITVPVGDKLMTGRTTRLDLGTREELVDRNSWVMP